ncbi:prion-like-(Q/N-rich) domain-bearing protein 25 [Microplitis demolitor]|uniref:prion-like-(Q/N-rich) domain-bearing protein 25 n=1 Tax=Microplitis demolitor TaxID=69319 RepID=UPI0006D52778|nr:prion-like-(Q/N-rich) domain-bearing protein 25 [Microplitis demolitor]
MSKDMKFLIISFILSSFTIIVNSFSSNYDDYDNQCVFRNSLCDPSTPRSCCDQKDVCKQINSQHVFKCIEKTDIITLGQFCITDEDCDRIRHSKCSTEKKCICRMNNIELNQTTCAPILGGFCWKSELCATTNAVCIDNESKLGVSCKHDFDCKQIMNSLCSEDERCECISNYAEYNSTTCAPLLGGYCATNKLCAPLNSVCSYNICICDDGFSSNSNDRCQRRYLRISCIHDDHCVGIKYAKCSQDKKCVCKSNYVLLGDEKCIALIGEYCDSDEESGFLYHCDQVSDCGDPWHNKCSVDKKCICNKNNVLINKSTCLPLLKGYCWVDHQCVVENSFCTDFRCECQRNFIPASTNLCIPVRGV